MENALACKYRLGDSLRSGTFERFMEEIANTNK